MQVKTLAIITAATVAVVLAAPEGAQAFEPVPVCDPNGPYTIWVGTDLTLDGSGSWVDSGQIVSYEWDIDLDGTADFFGEFVTVDWNDLSPRNEVGQTYPIRLTVTDDNSNAASCSTTYQVVPEPTVAILLCLGGLDLLIRRRRRRWSRHGWRIYGAAAGGSQAGSTRP